MAWEDPPSLAQQAAIGKLARALGYDEQDFFPLANRREANTVMFNLLGDLKMKRARAVARRISQKVVGE